MVSSGTSHCEGIVWVRLEAATEPGRFRGVLVDGPHEVVAGYIGLVCWDRETKWYLPDAARPGRRSYARHVGEVIPCRWRGVNGHATTAFVATSFGVLVREHKEYHDDALEAVMGELRWAETAVESQRMYVAIMKGRK